MMIWQDRNMSECFKVFKSVLCEIICAFVGWWIEVILQKMHGATLRFIDDEEFSQNLMMIPFAFQSNKNNETSN